VFLISFDGDVSFDFEIIYGESLASEEESSWTIGKSMPTPRTEIAVTLVEDKIYVIGGFDKFGNVLDTVEVYDITTDTWKTVEPLPQPLHHIAATTFNGSIYVIGGYTNNNWMPSSNLYIYDPKNDIWIEGSQMPTARGALTAVFIDKKLYAIGGEGVDGIMDHNEIYDSKTKSWLSKSPMPTARHHTASAIVDGKVYVIGGRIEGDLPITNTNVTEMYDPEIDEWTILESMPSKRSGITATSYNDKIFVFGGEDITRTFENNEKYNTNTDEWVKEESLPTSRHGLGSVHYNNNIYVIGGGPKPGLSVSNINEIFNIK
jgi:N-acetylneuraminic acid mutarotase